MLMTDGSNTGVRAFCLAATAALTALLAGCAANRPDAFAVPLPYKFAGKGVATVKSYEGYVLVQVKRWQAWQKLESRGAAIPDGAKVRTEDGRVALKIPGVGTIRLGPRTLIDMNRERSMNLFKKRRMEFPIYLERGKVEVACVKKPKGFIWITTEVFAAKLVEGAMTVAAPEPMFAKCDSGSVVLRLLNGGTVNLPAKAAVSVHALDKEEARVRAEAGRSTIRLDDKRSVAIAADGFDPAGRVCATEVDLRRE